MRSASAWLAGPARRLRTASRRSRWPVLPNVSSRDHRPSVARPAWVEAATGTLGAEIGQAQHSANQVGCGERRQESLTGKDAGRLGG